MHMPPAVQSFFAAEDPDVVTGVFTPDAIVKDEGHSYNGRQAIRQWRIATKQKYHYVSEPFEVISRGDKVKVRANVTGDFPGSPIVLGYLFHMKEVNIHRLEITHD